MATRQSVSEETCGTYRHVEVDDRDVDRRLRNAWHWVLAVDEADAVVLVASARGLELRAAVGGERVARSEPDPAVRRRQVDRLVIGVQVGEGDARQRTAERVAGDDHLGRPELGEVLLQPARGCQCSSVAANRSAGERLRSCHAYDVYPSAACMLTTAIMATRAQYRHMLFLHHSRQRARYEYTTFTSRGTRCSSRSGHRPPLCTPSTSPRALLRGWER
jgi:hypothetical protein